MVYCLIKLLAKSAFIIIIIIIIIINIIIIIIVAIILPYMSITASDRSSETVKSVSIRYVTPLCLQTCKATLIVKFTLNRIRRPIGE